MSRGPSETTWKSAFMSTPGPSSGRSAALLAVKGAFMGAADTVPGVSGGTIALITGIYEDLLAAVKSVNARSVKRLLSLDIKGAMAEVHVRFLVCIFCGIGIAVLSLARLMTYLIDNHPVPTWSLFFGLIAASLWVVGKKVNRWSAAAVAAFLIGAVSAYFIVGMVPAQTPETFSFVFLSGMLAICAMILPGLSGAFILLILGKYEFILGALENPFLASNLAVLGIFALGCAFGLAGFSRVLKFMLEKFYNPALACLTGLMLGSMRKIWPWKTPVRMERIHGELMVINEKNVLPDGLWPETAVPVLLMAAGFVAVLLLARLTRSATSE